MPLRVGRFRTDFSIGGLPILAIYLHLLFETTSKRTDMSVTTEYKVPESTRHGLPEKMRAAAIDRFGGAELLKLQTLPVPELEKGEILIEVDTAGVGSWDAAMRAGWWPEGNPQFPLVLGSDGSGRVAAMETPDRRFRIGDPVYSYSFANPRGGFYGEYVVVAAESAAPI